MASSEIVKLNVGGVIYTTTKSTLCKYPNSMLGAMFNGSMSKFNLDENGCVFIDRDGELFKYILNYLRSSRLALPCDFKDLDQLTVEADFYQITPLIEHIEMLKVPEPVKRIRMRYLEVIEVRTGNLATMPTMNSRIKTIISGRRDIIHKYLSTHQIHPAERERLQLNTGKDFTEIALTGSNVRLQVGECLRNQGWELAESQMSTFPSGEAIAHNYKDRWSLAQVKGDQSLEESQCIGIDDETLDEISLLSNEEDQ